MPGSILRAGRSSSWTCLVRALRFDLPVVLAFDLPVVLAFDLALELAFDVVLILMIIGRSLLADGSDTDVAPRAAQVGAADRLALSL